MKKLDPKRKPKNEVIDYIVSCGLHVLEDFEYENQDTRIHLEDEHGYRYYSSYSLVYNCFERNGELRKFHKSNTYSIYNIDVWLKSLGYSSKIVGGKYINESIKTLEFICDKGHSFMSSFAIIRGSTTKGGCNVCSGRTVVFENSFGGRFPELIILWSSENKISPYEISWGNSTIKVLWKCLNGHKDYPCTVANKKEGKGCPSCGGKVTDENNLLVSNHPFLSEWDYEKNGDPSDYGLYSNQKVSWICPSCGNNYPSIIANRTLQGNGCPNCLKYKGEDTIKKFLLSYHMGYIPQNRFFDCRDKNTLPFDFYLPDYNLCIEFHGIQHYEPQKFFGGDDKFKDRQKKDAIKFNYCKKRKIELLVIPYWEFDNIEKILEQALFE